MKEWKIPVTWEVYATIMVEADTLEEAMEIARDDDGIIACPTDSYYVDESWRLSDTDPDYIRECFNGGQEDSGLVKR